MLIKLFFKKARIFIVPTKFLIDDFFIISGNVIKPLIFHPVE